MKFIHEQNRIYANDEKGKVVAEITFPEEDSGVVNIDHTFVDTSLRGQGIASKLMQEACKEIEDQGKRAIPTCPYAIKWFEKNHRDRERLVKK